MFKAIIVFLLMLAIILFPIPLKITLKYSNKVLEIYVYNKKLNLNNLSKKDLKNNIKSKSKPSLFKDFTLRDINLIIYKIKNLKFKPTLTLNTKVEYGFDDAAFVAILFGLINSAFSLFYLQLIKFVKLKKIDFKIIPTFRENYFYMEISSIIYASLAKIIYIISIMLICFIQIKNNKPSMKKYEGGNLHG